MIVGGDGNCLSEIEISGYEDILLARQQARVEAQRMGFSLVDQTKIVTAVSELARNIVVHAGKGTMRISRTAKGAGLVFNFKDRGPGLADDGVVLREGDCAANALGLGLSGARALSDTLAVQSTLGEGTSVTITKYLHR